MLKNKCTYFSALILSFLILAGAISSAYVNPPDRVLAFVKKYKPTISIQNAKKDFNAQKATPLYSGDTLSTDETGFALVQFVDKSFAQVKPKSQLTVEGTVKKDKSTAARIFLETGAIFLNITKRANPDFEVTTTTSVASVKGTQFGARFDGYYYVLEGVIELRSIQTGETVTLGKNTFGQVNEDGSIDKGELTNAEIQRLENEKDTFDDILEPKVLKLRFRDENGEIKEIEIKYFEN